MLPGTGVLTTKRISPRRASRLLRTVLPVLLASLFLTLVLTGMSIAAPAELPQTVVYNAAIADIISRITTQTLAYELAGLTGERPVIVAGSPYTIATRHSYQTQAISMATRYVYEQLADSGLVVTYHNYSYSGYQLRNVVAEKPGLVNPDEIYLITAHMDDLPLGPRAPGADDNGSGSVAVLMAARLLAPRYFAHTIRFVLFTGEEQGLRGSDAYAADCASRSEDIQAVVNLDMIAYNTGDPVYDVYAWSESDPGAPESRHLAGVFSDVVGIYDLDLVPHQFDVNRYPLTGGSDQWSFLKRGYPAILIIEDYEGDDFTPHYHSASDTLSTLDLDYCADLTRGAIATIAHLGQLLPGGYLSGTVRALDTGHPLSATVSAYTPAYGHTFAARTSTNGAYSLSLPIGSYTLTVSPSFPNYYPATITDVLIFTDTITVRDIALEPRTFDGISTTLTPDRSGSALPGESAIYTHVLTNGANVDQTFSFATDSSQGWDVEIRVPGYPSGTLVLPYALPPGGGVSVTVTVQVPNDTLSGTVDATTVTAIGSIDGIDAITDSTTVRFNGAAPALTPDRSGDALPGEYAIYTHTLINSANAYQTFDITAISSEEYSITLVPTRTDALMAFNGSTTITVTIQVPADATPGTVDTTIVTATGDVWGSGSVTDTTTIESESWYIYLPLTLRNYGI